MSKMLLPTELDTGHVAQALAGHYDAGDEVRDGCPSRQDGQAHDLLRDSDRLPHLHTTRAG